MNEDSSVLSLKSLVILVRVTVSRIEKNVIPDVAGGGACAHAEEMPRMSARG